LQISPKVVSQKDLWEIENDDAKSKGKKPLFPAKVGEVNIWVMNIWVSEVNKGENRRFELF